MQDAPSPGVPVTLEPGLRRILAPNPSPMTHWGTNTHILGQRDLAIVDPGPDAAVHLDAIRAAVGDTPVRAILVTHAHRDHSPLAPRLSQMTGAPVMAFGPAQAGRSATMERLARAGLTGGGEGVDQGFAPDRTLSDGETVAGADWRVTALHTPGHFAGHLSFAMGDAVLTGDLVMGWASTLISPPDGDLAAFMASCTRLRGLGARVFYPGHGAPVHDPGARIDWLLAHRRSREAAILKELSAHGPAKVEGLAQRIYTDTPPALLPAAARNVLAHLIDLTDRGIVAADPALARDARFRRL